MGGMTLSIVLLFIPMAPIIIAPAFVCAGMWLLADRTNMGFVSKPASQFDLKGTALFYGFAFVAIIWSEVTWVFFFATHGPRSIVAPAVISYIVFDLVLLLAALVLRIYIIVSDRRRAGKGSNEMAEFVAAGGVRARILMMGLPRWTTPGQARGSSDGDADSVATRREQYPRRRELVRRGGATRKRRDDRCRIRIHWFRELPQG